MVIALLIDADLLQLQVASQADLGFLHAANDAMMPGWLRQALPNWGLLSSMCCMHHIL